MKRAKGLMIAIASGCAFAISLISAGCGPTAKYVYAEGAIWNTTYHVTYEGDIALADSIVPILEKFGKSVSVFDSGSLVSRLNEADSCQADASLSRIFRASVKVNSESGGMFDPTLSPLIAAWGFGKGHKAGSDTLRLDSLLEFVGIDRCRYRENGMIVKPDRRMQFNFSAIAKGAGCDEVARMLKRNGVRNLLVEIGGEIYCAGHNSSGNKWRVSIDKPALDPKGISHVAQGVLEVSDCGVATSGNYRNFHELGGKNYGHTISPKTGRPLATDLASATVIAPDAMTADAYATACMALGSRGAEEMLRRNGLKGVLITSRGATKEIGVELKRKQE